MRVVVLTGPESSGKSWLAREIQQQFGGIIVDEFVRHFIEQVKRDTCLADVDPIANGQLAWEDQARSRKPDLLILDTHLLSNMLWSQTLFGACPAWLEQALLEREYHLHLLLDPVDVPWINDGQRCQPDIAERLAFYAACERWLQLHQQPYVSVKGDWSARRAFVLEAIANGH